MNWGIFSAGALVAALLSFLLHMVDVDRIEKNQRDALATQKTELLTACSTAQVITKGANDDLQNGRDAIDSKLAGLNGLHKADTCIVPTTSDANPSASGGRPTGHNGTAVSTKQLRTFAAHECARYRQERIVLEGVLKKEREALGQ